jgi:KUP system potassium uptake protein
MLLHHVQQDSVLHETVVLMTFLPDRRPRVPFAQRHAVERFGHGFFHIQVKLGFMRTPDIPLTLRNCELLGFEADVEHANYYIGHEIVVRRAKDSAMGPVSFAIFAFLTRIASRAPDFFKIPHQGLSEVGFRVEI